MPVSLISLARRRGVANSREQLSHKKKKENSSQPTELSTLTISSHLSASHHQHHHSAPPTHHQGAKTGLDSINENVEYLPSNEQVPSVNHRFPRSSTVPYPAYATVRKGPSPASGGYFSPPLYCYADYPSFVHGTVSPAQQNTYFYTRQPLSSINTDFQPISPYHHQYTSRPVDILKPTFLLVPRAAEQRLAAQLSASNSPNLSINGKSRPASAKSTSKPVEKRSAQKTTRIVQQSPTTVRNVEVQTSDDPTITTPNTTTMENGYRHFGLLATPNPSPYVHFGNPSSSAQSTQYPRESPNETSTRQDEQSQSNEDQQQQGNTSVQSMQHITLVQASSHPSYGSPISRHYFLTQQHSDEQQQLLTGTELTTDPQLVQVAHANHLRGRNEIGETDESSIASLDFAHTDLVEMPGSWRYRSAPSRSVPRRYRAPLPQAFLDTQQYVSDSEQVVQSSSYRQQQLFGSIPTINRPFDSIRSQAPFQGAPALRLIEKDIIKIASFYRSIGTLVYVARSLATLYSSDFDAMANLKDWKQLYTGVPIWLFNTGMNPKRSRCIRLIISELGSSFTLWDTVVNGASDVRLPKPRHMTLKSLETGTILALKFDDTTATDEFHQYFVKLSCDPRNTDLFDVFNIKRRRPVFVLRKRKIKKSAISKPTKFNHITKVDEHDRDSLYTFSVLVDDGFISG